MEVCCPQVTNDHVAFTTRATTTSQPASEQLFSAVYVLYLIIFHQSSGGSRWVLICSQALLAATHYNVVQVFAQSGQDDLLPLPLLLVTGHIHVVKGD